MTVTRRATEPWRRHGRLADLLRNVSYEVVPFKSTERAVVENVPTSVPLTVTVTEARGLAATLWAVEP
jgi:methylenetetrahydrofolate reductase (NADPH)